jgi:hypothetical protein
MSDRESGNDIIAFCRTIAEYPGAWRVVRGKTAMVPNETDRRDCVEGMQTFAAL